MSIKNTLSAPSEHETDRSAWLDNGLKLVLFVLLISFVSVAQAKTVSDPNHKGWSGKYPKLQMVSWKPVTTKCENCTGISAQYNETVQELLNSRYWVQFWREAQRFREKGKKDPFWLGKGDISELEGRAVSANLELFELQKAQLDLHRKQVLALEQQAQYLSNAIRECERTACPAEKPGKSKAIKIGGEKTKDVFQPDIQATLKRHGIAWNGSYKTNCQPCLPTVQQLNALPGWVVRLDLELQRALRQHEYSKLIDKSNEIELSHIEYEHPDKTDYSGLESKIDGLKKRMAAFKRLLEELLGELQQCEAKFCKSKNDNISVCPSPAADEAIVVGANSDVGSTAKFKEKAKQKLTGLASKAVSGLLGIGGGGGGKAQGPVTYKDPVKKKHKLRVRNKAEKRDFSVGGVFTPDGLLISTNIKKAPGKGTFETIFLENIRGWRLQPIRLYMYEIWKDWKLNVSWTRDTYVNGEHVKHEEGAWSESWRELITKGEEIEYAEVPIWQQLGFNTAVSGARSLGTLFPISPGMLAEEPINLSIHITDPKKDPVVTKPYIFTVSLDKKGRVKIDQAPQTVAASSSPCTETTTDTSPSQENLESGEHSTPSNHSVAPNVPQNVVIGTEYRLFNSLDADYLSTHMRDGYRAIKLCDRKSLFLARQKIRDLMVERYQNGSDNPDPDLGFAAQIITRGLFIDPTIADRDTMKEMLEDLSLWWALRQPCEKSSIMDEFEGSGLDSGSNTSIEQDSIMDEITPATGSGSTPSNDPESTPSNDPESTPSSETEIDEDIEEIDVTGSRIRESLPTSSIGESSPYPETDSQPVDQGNENEAIEEIDVTGSKIETLTPTETPVTDDQTTTPDDNDYDLSAGGLDGYADINAKLEYDIEIPGSSIPPTIYGEELDPQPVGILLQSFDPTWVPENRTHHYTIVRAKMYTPHPSRPGIWIPDNIAAEKMKVSFIARSSEPGEAMNSDLDGRNQSSPDLFFSANRNFHSNCSDDVQGDGRFATCETRSTENEQMFAINSEDFGGFSRLDVSCENCVSLRALSEKPSVELHSRQLWPLAVEEQNQEERAVYIPKDDNRNQIADGFLRERLSPKGAAYDGEGVPIGNSVDGDGLSAYQEYRGFRTRSGRHVRTNWDQKTLLIRNLNGASLNLFETASGLEIVDIAHTGQRRRIVNFNSGHAHLVAQHGVYLSVTENFNEKYAGYCYCDIDRPKSVSLVVVKPEYKDQPTVAHELGHAVGMHHHGDHNWPTEEEEIRAMTSTITDLWPGRVHSGPRLCGKALPASFLVGTKGDQGSGNENCIMRYGHIGYVYEQDGGDYDCMPAKDRTLFDTSNSGTGPNSHNRTASNASRGNCSSQMWISSQ